jgi:hypothetical protein
MTRSISSEALKSALEGSNSLMTLKVWSGVTRSPRGDELLKRVLLGAAKDTDTYVLLKELN